MIRAILGVGFYRDRLDMLQIMGFICDFAIYKNNILPVRLEAIIDLESIISEQANATWLIGFVHVQLQKLIWHQTSDIGLKRKLNIQRSPRSGPSQYI